MAAIAEKLTLAEFEEQYGGEKPYYEFWHGEAVQKAMANSTHGLLERILMDLLSEAGYKAGAEITLKIDPDFQPIPDVVATGQPMEFPYPTRALDIVAEILSPDDRMSRILAKCRAYQSWGFEQIYVIDPDTRVVFRWSDHRLEEVNTFASRPVDRIWSSLDKALK